VKLTTVGVSGSAPGPESPGSCYLVQAEDFSVVLDLGNGSWGPLQRLVAPDRIDAVLFSHLHADHCADISALAVHRRYGLAEPPTSALPVWAPAGADPRLTAVSWDTANQLPGVFSITEMTAGTHSLGPLSVTFAPVAHPVPAFGMRIEHAGGVLVYTGDSGPCRALEELAVGADVLLAEAGFATRPGNPPDLHLTGADAGRLAAEAGVRHLVLTHIPPWNSAEEVRQEAARAYEGEITVATSGWSIEI